MKDLEDSIKNEKVMDQNGVHPSSSIHFRERSEKKGLSQTSQ